MNLIAKPTRLTVLAMLLAWPASLLAQGRDVFIESNRLTKNDASLIAKAQALKDAGRLVLDTNQAAATWCAGGGSPHLLR